MKRDDTATVQELKDLIIKFRDERGWRERHAPQNLAMSIAIEAAELLEHFQWDDWSKSDTHQAEIADELADVLIFCFSFADICGIDISTTFQDKLQKAAKKYPAERFNPSSQNRSEYHKIKRSYRKGRK